jgi:hypothetical protein
MLTADRHGRGAPDLVVARARLDRDEPRRPGLGLLVVGHEVEPAVPLPGGAQLQLAAALAERERDLVLAEGVRPTAAVQRHVVAGFPLGGTRAERWISGGG